MLAKPLAGWDWELEHPTGNEQLPPNRHEGLGMEATGQTDPMQPQIQPRNNRDGGGLHSGQVMSE